MMLKTKYSHKISDIQKTIMAIEDYLTEQERYMFSDDDINMIAQDVDQDIREIPLDNKIYDAIQLEKDLRKETL